MIWGNGVDLMPPTWEQSYLKKGLEVIDMVTKADKTLSNSVERFNRSLGLNPDDLNADEVIELMKDWGM